MEETDIRYPSYFQGTWNAVSKTANVYAPCGYELFSGGKAAYDNTIQKEVAEGETLQYRARFVRGDDSLNGGGEKGGGVYIAADREYNAKEIAKAAMGSYSVVDVSVATPNRFSCVLAPPGGTSGEMNNLIAVVSTIHCFVLLSIIIYRMNMFVTSIYIYIHLIVRHLTICAIMN